VKVLYLFCFRCIKVLSFAFVLFFLVSILFLLILFSNVFFVTSLNKIIKIQIYLIQLIFSLVTNMFLV